MTYNRKVEKQTIEMLKLLRPALVKRAGRYETAWGRKTEKGLKASLLNILVEIDMKWRTERG